MPIKLSVTHVGTWIGIECIFFYKLDIVTRYHQWHRFVILKRILHTIWPMLQRRIFIINYVSMLCFCSVVIFWRCEASNKHMALKKCSICVFRLFCVLVSVQSFIFYGHISCSVPQSASLSFISLLCMTDTFCPLWRIIRATEMLSLA